MQRYAWTSESNRGSVWRWNGKWLRLSVHRLVHAPPEAWFMTCYELCISRRELEARELLAAQDEAVGILRAQLARYAQDLEQMEIRHEGE